MTISTPNKPQMLQPCGHSIGIYLPARAVKVYATSPVVDPKGKIYFPCREAGIEIGDKILEIEQVLIKSNKDLIKVIQSCSPPASTLRVKISRGDSIIYTKIKPCYCHESKQYRIGLYTKDEINGVGTLTFVDPFTNTFGALGHIIRSANSGQQIVERTRIVPSSVNSIQKSINNHPGEKIASFEYEKAIGFVSKNTESGLYGTLNSKLTNRFFPNPILVSDFSNIKLGPAKVYTVLNDQKVEEFDIVIDKFLNRTDSINFVLRVTDSKLLSQTGGIVQGMSGSPIVQDGRLLGAIGHVFVKDGTYGYGVFIQNMLNDACNSLKSRPAA